MVVQGIGWGNFIGFVGCAGQYYGHLLSLNPNYYYIPYVPIAWDWSAIIGLNSGLLALATTVLYGVIRFTIRGHTVQATQLQ